MKIKTLYYIPFDVELLAPESEDSLRHALYWKLQPESLSRREEQDIFDLLGNKCCPARFEARDIRLLIDFEGADGALLLDGSGCVKYRGESYYIIPTAYLRLYKMLEFVHLRQKKKRRP